jgi:hypothetical protein
MEVQKSASTLDGLVMWGSVDTLPPQCDYILDTRHGNEGATVPVPEGEWEIELYPIRLGMEPEFEESWYPVGKELVSLVKNGKKIYIVDSDGTERAAMIAWFVYTKIKNCHPDDGLADIQIDYLKWVDRPRKWYNTRVPRFARQVMWCTWQLLDITWDAFTNIFGKTIKRGKKGPLRVNGGVCCGEAIHQSLSTHYRSLRKHGWQSIHITGVGGTGENWTELKPENFCNITYKFQHIGDSIAVQNGATLTHIWKSFFIYNERHLDSEGKPNSTFFIDQDTISRDGTGRLQTHHLYDNHPDGVWWFGEIFPYEYALVYIWSPLYAYFVEKTQRYDDLKNLVVRGIDVLLLDYDAACFEELGFTYAEYVDTCPRKWSVAHVLYGLLKNERPWDLGGVADMFIVN